MKLNIGDVVELQFEGSNLPGVVTAVTPERVELAFTYNLFMEGPAVLTWGDGTQQPLKVGLDNGLTKLHLRLPLEEVARAQAMNAATSAATAPAPQAASEPEPEAVDEVAEPVEEVPQLADPDADLFSGASLDTDALTANVSVSTPAQAPRPASAQASSPPAKAESGVQRPGIWVDYETRVDGFDPESGGSFVGTTTKVCVAGQVLRLESGSLKVGSRVQLLFGIERDNFDLPAIVTAQEGADLFGIQYDEAEARPRLLKVVLKMSKAEVRPQRNWR